MEENETAKEIIKAVAHIGIDFGYGKYELEDKWIDKARELLEQELSDE
jgi:predicted adenine nucleotide alpha hydrolase (AANH) superfamily ATPase